MLGALRLVLFAPEDLALVRGDPAERRRYLDDLLVTRQPRYAGVRADYERVLKQRNALLRTAYLARKTGGDRGGDLSTLDVWDTHLAQHGAELLAGRLELVAALAPHVAKAYDAVSRRPGRRRASPTGPSVELADAGRPTGPRWTEALTRGRWPRPAPPRSSAGVTLVGPHRDDLTLTLGELPAKGYASHGESWSYALALRLAAYDLLRADGIEPVLVLDDVFAELDAGRRERLAELVGGGEPAAGHLRGRRRRAGAPCAAPATQVGGGDGAPCRMSQAPIGQRPARPGARTPSAERIAAVSRRRPPAGRSWPGRCSTRRARRSAAARARRTPGGGDAAAARRGGCAATPARAPTRATRSRSAPCWTG